MTKPTGNHVFVKRLPSPVSSGGIHLLSSDINASDVLRFQVVSVGPGRRTKKGALVPIEAHEGDYILWQSYTGAPEPLTDGIYMIDAKDILGILERVP